jgi:predicted secreted Zn-dependent protease
MVRKQLYLKEAQDRALKRRAEELGISEAEVVRRALDEALFEYRGTSRRRALEAFLTRAAEVATTNLVTTNREPYRFDRQELYEEDRRFRRWDKGR